MISSKAIEALTPLFEIIKQSKGKTIQEIKKQLVITRDNMKKGASGLIVENLLGIKNNSNSEPDLPEIECEIKVLPLQLNRNGTIKAKEPTQIQMINYIDVANETWGNAKIRKKIKLTFWIVYLSKISGKALEQNEYKIVDYYLDHPTDITQEIFRKDWELIQSYIIKGLADKLSCSMGVYIEPKTKGKNNLDTTTAPDGKGGITRVRRRAFYYKKLYTNTMIIPNIDKTNI